MQRRRRVAFGQHLRDLRIEQELSQERLAEHAGLHRTYVSGIERGVRNVSFDNICRLADALAMHPADLFPRDL